MISLLPSLARRTDAMAHSPGRGASEQAGGLAAAAEGQEGSSSWTEVRFRGLGWAETVNAWSSCYAVSWATCWSQTLQGQPVLPCCLGQACPPLSPHHRITLCFRYPLLSTISYASSTLTHLSLILFPSFLCLSAFSTFLSESKFGV